MKLSDFRKGYILGLLSGVTGWIIFVSALMFVDISRAEATNKRLKDERPLSTYCKPVAASPTPTRRPTSTPVPPRPTVTPMITPEPTSTPSATPTPTGAPPAVVTEVKREETGGIGGGFVCDKTNTTLKPMNAHLYRFPTHAVIKWHKTEGDKINVIYYNNSNTNDRHGTSDVNDGYLIIDHLSSIVGYTFELQQANGCSGGPVVKIVDPPSNGRLFRAN